MTLYTHWARRIGGELGMQFAESRGAVVAAMGCVAFAAAALAAPWIAPQDPYDLAALDLHDSRLPPGSASGTGGVFWLGSDVLGRDLLSAILYGLRTSLSVGIASGVLAMAFGTVMGLIAAYRGGRLDAFIMRWVDLQLSFPAILVALILLAVLGKGIDKIVLALVLVQWAFFARTVRAAALAETRKEYMEAARGQALPHMRILFRHLMPNCLTPVIVIATMQIAAAVSLEATLSFLGIGLPITEPSLGLLIANGFQFMLSGEYWISFFPGLALLLLIVSINFVGDRLRQILHPRYQPLPSATTLAFSVPPPAPGAPSRANPLLRVASLHTYFFSRDTVARSVEDVSFTVMPGQVVGVVGESGSGKSVTGRSIMRLIDFPGRIVGGEIRLGERDLLTLDEEAMRQVRGRRAAMIFQDPMMTLNPVMRIGAQMVEAIAAHRKLDRKAARAHAIAMLEKVGIADAAARFGAYPHELSGGMRQRVAIAIALLNEPDLIIADEPTTALDVTIQAQIIAEIQELIASRGISLIWISHDLAVVGALADHVLVMYAGRIVEAGPTAAIIERPLHPYTEALLACLPERAARNAPLRQISGTMPPPTALPAGCVFQARCPKATAQCGAPVALRAVDGNRQVRCIHAGEPTP
ncbi:MAG: ABC transporter permease subunit [Alphaproteobacteria bacterium]|nr:MAG: ABC transporter permease subunit [Alphaproteobacteria bacterium]